MSSLADWKQLPDGKEKYNAYLCSREWAEKRESVRRRSKDMCERCRSRPMEICHHLTYARKYNETLEDLQSLCRACHEFTHGKTDRDPLKNSTPTIGGKKIHSVYLSGRFACNWRKTICAWSELHEYSSIPCNIPDGRFVNCIGPRFEQLDRHDLGCGPHRSAQKSGYKPHDPLEVNRPKCVIARMQEIEKSDLCFCWIDDLQAFGTLVEIGVARSIRPRPVVVVAVPSHAAIQDTIEINLWFALTMADLVVYGTNAKAAWDNLWTGKAKIFEAIDRDDFDSQQPIEGVFGATNQNHQA